MAEAAYSRVRILGEEYRVAGDTSVASIPELAAFVDDKMEEVRRKSNHTSDTKRIAVLTALNLADELFQERARSATQTGLVRERVEESGFVLEETLTEPDPGSGSGG